MKKTDQPCEARLAQVILLPVKRGVRTMAEPAEKPAAAADGKQATLPRRKAVTVLRDPIQVEISVADASIRLALEALETVKRERNG
jgi:hypothetical protein